MKQMEGTNAKDHEEGIEAWKAFSESVRLAVIKGGGHFFIWDQIEQVAQVVGNA